MATPVVSRFPIGKMSIDHNTRRITTLLELRLRQRDEFGMDFELLPYTVCPWTAPGFATLGEPVCGLQITIGCRLTGGARAAQVGREIAARLREIADKLEHVAAEL